MCLIIYKALIPAEENEVTNIVRSCKNKKSTGYDNVDMVIVKKVISNIVVPIQGWVQLRNCN